VAEVIEASNLTRRFGNRVAVERVSFAIRQGEIFALLGPNGAGKTTTMRMLAALIPPTEGRVRIAGMELTRKTAGSIRARVGLLTETPGLWDRLEVYTNLLVYARLYGLARPADAVEAALRRFGLWDRRDDLAVVLSKGMKQKVALARALIHAPPVVLLDEPTAGLDPQTARDVRELVLELRRDGRAVLVSTHNLDEAERMADRIGVLEQRLIAVDTPDALRRRLFGRRVLIHLLGPAARFEDVARRIAGREADVDGDRLSLPIDEADTEIPAIVRALVEAGAAIREVSEEQPTLEDVYLKVLGESRSATRPDA
jgi:ABC-2 type transport system ATP-binding protein